MLKINTLNFILKQNLIRFSSWMFYVRDGFPSNVTGMIDQYARGNEPFHHIVYLSDRNKYIRSVGLNGKLLKTFKFTYDEIKNGRLLSFEMIMKCQTVLNN